tara:strand:- start:1086 stop:1274 length:189 start_codon:yes stop_codon:yes gene_type:complete
MKTYEISVYRTIQQSSTVTVNTDHDPNDVVFMERLAEDEAAHLPDYDWIDGPIDHIEFFWKS